MVAQLPPIVLGSKKRRKKRSRFLRVLGSPKLTVGLGAVLGSLLFPAAALGLVRGAGRALIPRTVKGALKTAIIAPVAVGLLASSPRARELAKGIFDPRKGFRKGEAIGGLVQDPSGFLPRDPTVTGVGGRIRDVATSAGLLAGAGAALAGGALLVGTAVPRIRGFFDRAPSPQAPISIIPGQPVISQPLGPVQPAPEPAAAIPQAVMPSIKITNRPKNIINVNFRKSKKFINQQVLVNR